VKRKGAAAEPKKKWGQESFLFHRKVRKEPKEIYLNNFKIIFQIAPALTGITFNFTTPETAGIIEKRLPTTP
jgi:hypothetical protein